MGVEMVPAEKDKIAIWAITPKGGKLADQLARQLPEADIYVSQKISETTCPSKTFKSLSEIVEAKFDCYSGHIFVMSTGIVVRVIAPLIRSKIQDPAVVVVDDLGKNVISLLSGHIGGANELTRRIAPVIGATPVITTATDVNRVPAIDVLAKERNLFIENPGAIKTVNMALLKGEKIFIHDPFNLLKNRLPRSEYLTQAELIKHLHKSSQQVEIEENTYVYISDIRVDLPFRVLILRPVSLVAGIGCNRNTAMTEIRTHLEDVLMKHCLASSSLKSIASLDLKADEAGLIELAENLGLALDFYNRQELNRVKKIQNPSKVVEKHVGVKSVCEAAAILAAGDGTLIVPKQSTKNVTVAIARTSFLS
jgi:cobalt-precorrin 5A hydrolase